MACYRHFTLVMGRSLGFASAHTDSLALFRLALATAHGPQALNLASVMQLVGSLCKRHAVAPYDAPTACKRTVSGSISLPCSGCFPPFPHGTGPLSVFRECLALRDGPRRFGQDSTCPALLRCPTRRIPLARTGLSPSAAAVSTAFRFGDTTSCEVLQPRRVRKRAGLGSAPFARHYSGYRFFLSLPPGTKMFQFPGFAPSSQTVHGLQPCGLPHSDMLGSKPVCSSPSLFAAYHVLLRLRIAKASSVRSFLLS